MTILFFWHKLQKPNLAHENIVQIPVNMTIFPTVFKLQDSNTNLPPAPQAL